jgi:hypothetical protein
MKPITTINKSKSARINDLVGKWTGRKSKIVHHYDTDQIILYIWVFGLTNRNQILKNRWHWEGYCDVRKLTMAKLDYIKSWGKGEECQRTLDRLCIDERSSFRNVVYGGKI